jgi:hypothetical protein
MSRKKTTVYVEEDLLRAAKVLAARTGKKEYEVFEEALKQYLGFDVLERVHERLDREGLALSEEESLKLAYEELHAMRAEERERRAAEDIRKQA